MRAAKLKMSYFWPRLGFVLLAACTAKEKVSEPAFKKVSSDVIRIRDLSLVKTATVAKKDFPLAVEMPGRIVIPDRDKIMVSARVQGRIEQLNVTVGDRVGHGQVIGSIWSPDLATAVEELYMARQQNNPQLVKLSQDKLMALGLQLGDAKRDQSTYPLRSPTSGTVLERKSNPGASVQMGDAILTIGKSGIFQFEGELPPEQAVKVKAGMKVSFDDVPSLSAVIEMVSPVADPSSRLIKVRCSIPGGLPSGLPQETFLKARVILKQSVAEVIPTRSIVFDQDKYFVFVRDAAQTDGQSFRRLPIEVESQNKQESAVQFLTAVPDSATVVEEGALQMNDVLTDADT